MQSKLMMVAVLGLALAGCGKKDKDGGAGGAAGGAGGAAGKAGKLVGSCDQRAMPGAPIKNCLEYMGSAWTEKEVQSRCAGEGQVFATTACPTEGVVLSCLQEAGKPMEAINRYYDDKAKAEKICASIGTPM